MQELSASAGTPGHADTAAIRSLFSPMQFTAVDGGTQHAVGLDAQGHAYAWGSNDKGQLGVGNLAGATTPQRIGTFSNVLSISAGLYHTMLVAGDGKLYGAGTYVNGALGNGQSSGQTNVMSPVAGAAGAMMWSAVYTLNYTNLGLSQDDVLYSWGSQYGNGASDTFNDLSPNRLTGMRGPFKSISAGDRFCAAIDVNGDMYLWGNNSFYQCAPAGRSPGVVLAPSMVTALPQGVRKFSMVAVGLNHGIAVDETGTTLWAWGTGFAGELGLGPSTRQTPQMLQVPLPANTVQIVKVFAAVTQSAALLRMSDGTMQVALWGLNDYGQVTGMGTIDATRIYSPFTTQGTLDYRNWFAMGLGADFVLAITG
jgi:alpha-tubulin suppressor-like RCC1 family protein